MLTWYHLLAHSWCRTVYSCLLCSKGAQCIHVFVQPQDTSCGKCEPVWTKGLNKPVTNCLRKDQRNGIKTKQYYLHLPFKLPSISGLETSQCTFIHLHVLQPWFPLKGLPHSWRNFQEYEVLLSSTWYLETYLLKIKMYL